MSRTSEAIDSVDAKKRPYGYICVNRSMSASAGYPVTQCELSLWYWYDSATFSFEIDLDRTENLYYVMMFTDREMENPGFIATVFYHDPPDSQSTVSNLVTIDPKMSGIEHPTLQMIHAVVFGHLIIDRTPVRENGVIPLLWYHAFKPTDYKVLQDRSGLHPKQLIATLNRALR